MYRCYVKFTYNIGDKSMTCSTELMASLDSTHCSTRRCIVFGYLCLSVPMFVTCHVITGCVVATPPASALCITTRKNQKK